MGDLHGQAGRPWAKKGGKKPVSGEPAMGCQPRSQEES